MDHDPPTGDLTELALRRDLARLADRAPTAIADLDHKIARRVADARRRRRAVLGAAAGVVLLGGAGAGGAAALAGRQPPQAAPIVALRDPLACPRNLGTFTPATAHPGLAQTMVPGAPSRADICGYADDGARWVWGAGPAPVELSTVRAQLNAAGTRVVGACARTQASGASEILYRFGYPAGAEVDVLVTVSGTRCPRETNGLRSITIPTALSIPGLTDQASSPAPAVPWSTPGNYSSPVSVPQPIDSSSPAPLPSQTSSFVSALPSPA